MVDNFFRKAFFFLSTNTQKVRNLGYFFQTIQTVETQVSTLTHTRYHRIIITVSLTHSASYLNDEKKKKKKTCCCYCDTIKKVEQNTKKHLKKAFFSRRDRFVFPRLVVSHRRFCFSSSFRVRRENARRMDDDDDDDDDSQFFTSLNVRFSKHVFEALRFVLLVIVGSTTRARSIPTDRILSSPFFYSVRKEC